MLICVVEATGKFKTRDTLAMSYSNGAKKVIFVRFRQIDDSIKMIWLMAVNDQFS